MSDSSNYLMPEFLSSTILMIIFSVFATLAVALRFWARKIQKARLELSDYLLVPALAFTLARAILYIYVLYVYLEIESEPEATVILAAKLQGVSGFLWVSAVTLIRSSVILLYIRIFPARLFRLTCYTILIINTGFFIGVFLISILTYFTNLFNPVLPESCSSCYYVFIELLGPILNLLLDVTMVVLPMPILWGLQMAVSKKVTLSGMFGLGTIICVITAVRLRIQIQASFQDGYDPKYDFKYSDLLFLEMSLGIVNGCLPVLKPVYSKVRDSMRRLGGRRGTNSSSKFGSIPILMRVSQMWQSRSGRRHEREDLDSTILTEDLRRNENGVTPATKAERVLGMKLFAIHVQRDVVESAFDEV